MGESMRRTVTLATAILLLLAACGPAGESPAGEPAPGQTPVDPGGDEPVPDEIDPADEAGTLTGTLDGDARLEGGCAWLDTDGDRFEILWPQGYEVEFDPLRVVGPDGSIVAERGDTLAVRGREAPDVATICQVGVPYRADEVERR